MKYEVRGTIELNFRVEVDADSEAEAEELGKGYAEDGNGLCEPTGAIDVHDVIQRNSESEKACPACGYTERQTKNHENPNWCSECGTL